LHSAILASSIIRDVYVVELTVVWKSHVELNVMSKLANFRSGAGDTTEIGYVNANEQQCHGTLGIKGTDHNQLAYRMECLHFGFVYGANGADIHERKCPMCQLGAKGIKYWNEV
jgi:hypothetical protein